MHFEKIQIIESKFKINEEDYNNILKLKPFYTNHIGALFIQNKEELTFSLKGTDDGNDTLTIKDINLENEESKFIGIYFIRSLFIFGLINNHDYDLDSMLKNGIKIPIFKKYKTFYDYLISDEAKEKIMLNYESNKNYYKNMIIPCLLKYGSLKPKPYKPEIIKRMTVEKMPSENDIKKAFNSLLIIC